MDPRFLFVWPNAQIGMESRDQMIEKTIKVREVQIVRTAYIYLDRKTQHPENRTNHLIFYPLNLNAKNDSSVE